MASPSLEYLRSPFENVFQILPQGHDKALKQAFYNTGATLFAVVVCCAAVAVYYILEAFLGPLLWAVLCGTFLHPFKNTLTSLVRGWLNSLENSGTPLIVGTALLPFQVLDSSSTRLGRFLWKNAYLCFGACLILPTLYLIFSLWPLGEVFYFFYASFIFVYEALGYFSAIWVWSLVAAYLVALYFLWTPESAIVFRFLSVPVWAALLLHLVTIAGPLRVPLFIMLIVLMVVGFISEWSETVGDDDDIATEDAPALPLTSRLAAYLTRKSPVRDESLSEVKDAAPNEGECPTDTGIEDVTESSQDVSDSNPKGTPMREPSVAEGASGEHSLSDSCFKALLWAIVLVQVWYHLWIIQLVPVLLACLLVKKVGAKFGSWTFLQNKATCTAHNVKTTLCSDSRVNVLAPRPIRGLVKLALRGDRKIVSTLEASMDKFMSVLIIIILIVGLILISFFVVIQVQKESVHLVTVTGNVLNRTEMSQWLPGHEDMQQAIDSMVGNAYVYGREWIINKLHGMLSGDDESKEKTQKEVLQVWDQVYRTWFAKNVTAKEAPGRQISRQMSLMELPDVNSIWDVVERTKDFNFDIVGFLQEHIGIFMSVVESVWSVLKGNLSLAFNLVTASVSLVFGGGTALLNFILSLMIFLTTLFYLLASSGDQYKPVEWFSNLSPAQQGAGNKFGTAVEEAISSVLLASLKMAVFYGLFTWWTHTLFDLQIVFIPSALAATFAAIPFLGTYFAAVPGIIELWLVREQPLQAVLLIVLHLLPSSVVDTAIYSDIKGGHPYMTGLAIAGGIYWLGLQGAVIGPILLCCLVVAVNMYSSMLQPDPVTPHVRQPRLRGDKKVMFQMKRGFSMPDPDQ